VKWLSLFISAFVLSLSLSGCSIWGQKHQPKPYQQNLLAKCPVKLAPLSDGTARSVALAMNQWKASYNDCATRHNGLVDAIRAAD
jgi:hypothetical protein